MPIFSEKNHQVLSNSEFPQDLKEIVTGNLYGSVIFIIVMSVLI